MDWGSGITYLGETTLKEKTVRFGIKDNDRTKHFSILGRSGSGRGDMLVSMALQDIERGVGVLLLDATGTSATKLLERIDQKDQERLVFLDPSDAEYPYSWNIFDDIKALPTESQADALADLLASLYEIDRSECVEYAAGLFLKKPDASLSDFHSLVTDEKFQEKFFEQDEDGKRACGERIENEPSLREALEERGKYIAKDTLVRNLVGQRESKFTLSHLAKGHIVIVDFSHIKMYPTRMTPLMRTFIHAAMLHDKEGGTPVSLYVHDAIRYLTEAEIESVFSPKGNLAVTVADTIIQEADAEKRRHALVRSASVASFAAHPSDSALLEQAFGPFADPEDLTKLELQEFIITLSIDGVRARPFFAKSLPLPSKKNISYQDMVVAARQKYTTVRSRVDASFKERRLEEDEEDNATPPAGPRGFQDASRSIFAKQAERAKQGQDQPPTPDAPTTPVAPPPPSAPEKGTDSKPEIPESRLKELLYVAPVMALIMFLLPGVALASVTITEVMYDVPGTDSGREWIEVQNTASATLSLDDWKLFEANTNHALTLISGGGIPPGGYAVLADNASKFLTDWPSFSGVLYDSAFSLSNSGELLVMRDPDGNDVSSVSYDVSLGAAGDGASLQRSGSSWIVASATPGEPYAASAPPPPAPSSQSTPDDDEEAPTPQSSPIPKTIFVDAGADRVVFAGADAVFEAESIGLSGEPLENARYVWTFGNGDLREGRSILYSFPYPGSYVVVVDVASGAYSASDRVHVTTVPAELSITEVTGEYIALQNGSAVEVDLGGWILFAAGKQFRFPANTILTAGQEVRISNTRTGLSGTDPATVALQYPNGLVAAAFEKPLFLPVVPSSAQERATTPVPTAPVSDRVEPAVSEGAVLTASAAQASSGSIQLHDSWWTWLLGAIALGASAGVGVVFLRRGGYNEYAVEEIQ